jgi:hypothetical protein
VGRPARGHRCTGVFLSSWRTFCKGPDRQLPAQRPETRVQSCGASSSNVMEASPRHKSWRLLSLPSATRTLCEGRLELRYHRPIRSASTAQEFGQVRAVHPCLSREVPHADKLATSLAASNTSRARAASSKAPRSRRGSAWYSFASVADLGLRLLRKIAETTLSD